MAADDGGYGVCEKSILMESGCVWRGSGGEGGDERVAMRVVMGVDEVVARGVRGGDARSER